MVTLSSKGNWNKTYAFLERCRKFVNSSVLDKYGKEGVEALSNATPVDTGLTASSWYYTTSSNERSSKITFWNSNIQNGVPIAIILQYGHGTINGGYVQGRDYINPAIRPIFDKILDNLWEEVTND